MDNKKFFYLANDTTFKYLFKNKKTRGFFEEIIGYYTRLDISDFEFIDNELNSGNDLNDYRLDSVLINKDKSIIINVEMNRKYKNYLSIRNRKYLHRLASNTDSKVIQVNFNCYLCHENKDISFNTYMLTDIENNLIEENFQIHNIYIPKVVKSCYNQAEEKLKLFLCDSYEKMREVVKNNKELEIIMDEIEKLNKEKYFGALYNVEEEHKMLEEAAKESGRKEGFLEGVDTEKINVAKKMLDDNLNIELISKYTGLSSDDIKKLQD